MAGEALQDTQKLPEPIRNGYVEAKFVRGADAYGLGKVCFPTLCNNTFMPGARKEIGLVERRVLICIRDC